MYSLDPSWYGIKRLVKNVAGYPPLNVLLVGALRRLPVSASLARLPVAAKEVKGRVGGIEYVLVRPDRCCIAKELFWGRGERVKRDEQLSLELFADLALDADVVLDIGANTGVFSIIAALCNAAADVHAFEIVPEVYEILFKNVVRNDVADRVACHYTGVGVEGFKMQVASTLLAPSLPTSIASTSTLRRGEVGTRVGFRALDRTCMAFAGDARILMKIDVEGTEASVFEGGWRSIARHKPRIVCEILVGVEGSNVLGKKLQSLGYHLYNITAEGLRESDSLHAVKEHHDWLFCLESPEDLERLTAVPIG